MNDEEMKYLRPGDRIALPTKKMVPDGDKFDLQKGWRIAVYRGPEHGGYMIDDGAAQLNLSSEQLAHAQPTPHTVTAMEKRRKAQQSPGVVLGDPETNLKLIEANVDMRLMLQEILQVLESGADFQLGPQGKHRDLPGRMRKLINGT